jgi:hypothetical protein
VEILVTRVAILAEAEAAPSWTLDVIPRSGLLNRGPLQYSEVHRFRSLWVIDNEKVPFEPFCPDCPLE